MLVFEKRGKPEFLEVVREEVHKYRFCYLC